MLLNIIEQRIGDHYLIAHAGDHRLDMGEQVSVQLGIVQQVVVILLVNVAQDVIHQRFVVVRADGFRVDVLHLASGKMHAEPGFFRRRKGLSRQLLQGEGNLMGSIAHVLRDLFRAEIRQRKTFTHPTYRHGAVQTDKALAFIGYANMMAR